MTVLFCPVLSCLFFSGTRPGQTAEPISTLYGSNDVFPRKEVPFGVSSEASRIPGNWGVVHLRHML